MAESGKISDMSPADWKKVSLLFDDCSDYPPEQWNKILNRRGETDESILAEVKKLLSNREKAGTFFDSLSNRIEAELSPRHQHLYHDGDRIGKFIVKRLISRGGMAVVYLAERAVRTFANSSAPLKANEQHSGDTGRVPGNMACLAAAGKLPRAAIKVMSCHAGNPWTSFRKEQNILSKVSHPNIAELYDYGITREGLLYIAMEYIDGVAVDRFCDLHGLGTGDRLRLVVQVCDAIQYSHGKQIIHQDIKPSNILVDRTGKVKVIDFGVAAILNDPGNRSRSGTGFSGTFSYAAPERLAGAAPSFSSDIYQIGMVIHKLITGDLPRTCFDPAALQEYFPGADNFPRKVMEEMASIFARTLSPDPAARYQRAEALAEDIRSLLAGIGSQ